MVACSYWVYVPSPFVIARRDERGIGLGVKVYLVDAR